VEGRGGEGQVGRYKLHRAVDEARSKLGKLSSPCIGAVPGSIHRCRWYTKRPPRHVVTPRGPCNLDVDVEVGVRKETNAAGNEDTSGPAGIFRINDS